MCPCGAGVAHSLGKGEATSSNLVMGIFEHLKSKIWVDARVNEEAKEKS